MKFPGYYILILFFSLSFLSGKGQDIAVMDTYSSKWGVKNSKGKLVIPIVYDTVFFVNDNPQIYGLGKILNGELLAGVLDKKGKSVLPFEFKSVKLSEAGILAITKDGFLSLYTNSGNLQKEGNYKYMECSDTACTLQPFRVIDLYFEGNKMAVYADSLAIIDSMVYAFRNSTRYPVCPISIRSIRILNYQEKECADALYGNDVSVLNDSIFSSLFDTVLYYSEGLAAIKSNGSYGFADSSGKILISVQYEDVLPFSEGMAPVKLMGSWGFIDRSENIVIQPYFDSVAVFCQGSALIKKDGKINFVDGRGKLRNGKGYSNVNRLSTGNWELAEGTKFGLANSRGRELIIPKYAYLKDLGDGFAIVKKHGFFGVLDYQQNIVIQFNYNAISSPYPGFFFAVKASPEEIVNISEVKDNK